MTEELTYTQIGEYLYPDLTLPETEEAPMGKYGMLMEYRQHEQVRHCANAIFRLPP